MSWAGSIFFTASSRTANYDRADTCWGVDLVCAVRLSLECSYRLKRTLALKPEMQVSKPAGNAKFLEETVEMMKLQHYCPDWDYLLIGPGMPEMEACLCVAVTPPTGCSNIKKPDCCERSECGDCTGECAEKLHTSPLMYES